MEESSNGKVTVDTIQFYLDCLSVTKRKTILCKVLMECSNEQHLKIDNRETLGENKSYSDELPIFL